MTRLVTITRVCGGWKDDTGVHNCGKKLGEWQEEDRGDEYYRKFGKESHGYCEPCQRKQYEAYGLEGR